MLRGLEGKSTSIAGDRHLRHFCKTALISLVVCITFEKQI